MSDAAIIDSALDLAHDLEEVFRLLTWARAYLFHVGELSLAEGVDVLQADAERDGLVELLGQDCVQNILAAAFAAVRVLDEPVTEGPSVIPAPEPKRSSEAGPGCCDICCCNPCVNPSFCSTCRAADADQRVVAERDAATAKLPPDWDRMSGEALNSAITRHRHEDRVTISTFRAVHYALSKHGQSALRGQAEHLRQFSDRQIEHLICSLQDRKSVV